MDSESALVGRKVYHIGPYGNSKLIDNQALIDLAGSMRNQQIESSQILQSYENSQALSYKSGNQQISQSQQQLKKVQIEPLLSKREINNTISQISDSYTSGKQLIKVDDDKVQHHNLIKPVSYKQPIPEMIGVPGAFKNQDLDYIAKSSQNFEESAHSSRLPDWIQGLTQFLCDQQFKKTGVYSRKEQELFKFWKNHVSIAHKMRKSQKYSLDNSLIQNQSYGFKVPSFYQKQNQENENENSIIVQYSKFERLLEKDVIFTIQKDLNEEREENYKIQNQKISEQQKLKNYKLKQQEQAEIQWMLEQYYEDLKQYQINNLKDRLNNDQVIVLTNESIEDIKDDNEQFNLQKSEIEKQILSQQNFMQRLLFFVRDQQMTNDPQQLIKIYKKQKDKSLLGLKMDNAEDIIKQFFSADKFLKRVQLYYSFKNRLGQMKHLSLMGFYLQIKQKQKLLNLIDWKPVKKEQNYYSTGDSYEKQYSVEEIIEEYEVFQKQQNQQLTYKNLQEQQEKQKLHKDKLLTQVFGSEKKLKLENVLSSRRKQQRIEELAKPKDKWKRGKILMDLKKKFPHDAILERMIKEEFKENKTIKFPEEYDLYDDEEDRLCKIGGQNGMKKQSETGYGKTLREKFKELDNQELYYLKRQVNEQRKNEKLLDEFIVERVLKYLEQKKKRLQGQISTVRYFLAESYHQMLEQFPELTEEKFPHMTYGTKKDSETYKLSFPKEFKRYFFKTVKSFVRTDRGLKRLKNAPPAFMIGGGKRCTMHKYTCPVDCTYTTLNKKILLKNSIYKRKQKDPHAFRSRVWRRNDFKNAINQIYMCRDEIENCTFEPEAGSLGKNIDFALKANPELNKEEFFEEHDPDLYFKKLGKNFEQSHPEVYKIGVLRRAKLLYKEGNYDKSMNTLYEGFNINSIKKRYDIVYMKRFIGEQILKKKSEREARETEEEERLSGRVMLQKETLDSQKPKSEEDFENKKLIPIFKEAFDLITLIENRRGEAEKNIKKIQSTQKELKKQRKNFSVYQKTQINVNVSKGEKILYRTIMCPLKEQCPHVKSQRWPTTNIKANTKFGQDCPFAHHPMEIKFPESIITKLCSSKQRIEKIKSKVMVEKPPNVFKPAGALFNCTGSANGSTRCLCNFCKYKDLANKSMKKFIDKKLKEGLMKTIASRESLEKKVENQEMHIIMKALDLDNQYTKKFGLLKKACILYFYGRYNDAFDEIAKAAKIIQEQTEIEKEKQQIIEKKWKNKLGLAESFELPIPFDQIDPNFVDEKFLRKLGIEGISIAVLKQYIDKVNPQKLEDYSKHKFLNKCIEDFYIQCEDQIKDKQKTIKKMKNQVDILEDNEALILNDEVGTLKRKKTKMCKIFEETGKCLMYKSRTCPFAHSAIELDLIPTENKVKNLNNVIDSQSKKLKDLKPIEPWRPGKQNQIEKGKKNENMIKAAARSKSRKRNNYEDNDEKDKKQKTIFERENIFKKPYEQE